MNKVIIALLSVLVLLVSVLTVQGLEHSRLSRGITCELYYIQGRVDTAKSLDRITAKLTKKDQQPVKQYIERIKNYQLFVAELDGEKDCIKIEYGLMEIIYFRLKNIIKEESK